MARGVRGGLCIYHPKSVTKTIDYKGKSMSRKQKLIGETYRVKTGFGQQSNWQSSGQVRRAGRSS